MRSHLAAATLVLSLGLGPSLAQSPETPAATSDPLVKSDPETPAKTSAKTLAKTSAKTPAKKSGSKVAAKGDPKAPVVPPAAGADAVPPPGRRNVAATGKTLPPAKREGAAPVKASTEVEMIKAQKAAEERNKAWDAKMRRTMSTICNGC